MTPLSLTYHQDPSHGWIEVPMTLIETLGIILDISPYSYKRNGLAYLEEDCDASVLLSAMTEQGLSYNLVRKATNQDSPIRNYQRF
jgi:dihydropteroate synthase